MSFDVPLGASADGTTTGAGQVAGGLALLAVDVGVAPIDPAAQLLGAALVLIGIAQRHRSSVRPWWLVAVVVATAQLATALLVAGAGTTAGPRRVPTRFDAAGPTWPAVLEVALLIAVTQAFRSSLPAGSPLRASWDTSWRWVLQLAVPALVVGLALGRMVATPTGGALAPVVVVAAIAGVVPVVHVAISSLRTARHG